jgi:hypothetical protein
MATKALPPPPINDAPGSFTWLEWYRQLREYISTSGSVPWYIINFADSNITDIQNRDHNALTNIQGGAAGERYHLTAAQHASLGAGEHNSLASIQGGSTTERYHLTELQYDSVTKVPTQQLMGRYAAGTGAIQYIDVGTNLELTPAGELNVTGLSLTTIDGSTLGDYLDDAEAAAGGVPIGGFYRTANAVMVRLT